MEYITAKVVFKRYHYLKICFKVKEKIDIRDITSTLALPETLYASLSKT